MNAFTRLLYAVLIAISFVTFVGVSVYSLYEPPKYPEYTSTTSDEDYNKTYEEHNKKEKSYQQNVTTILLPVAMAAMAIGIYLLLRKSEVIGEGVSLGGIATAIYAVITASIADSSPYRLIAVTLLLAGVLALAHFRFNLKEQKKR